MNCTAASMNSAYTEVVRKIKLTTVVLIVSAVGMLVSFPLQGYAFWSILFSTLHIFAQLGFTWIFFKETEKNREISVVFARFGSANGFCFGCVVSGACCSSRLCRSASVFHVYLFLSAFSIQRLDALRDTCSASSFYESSSSSGTRQEIAASHAHVVGRSGILLRRNGFVVHGINLDCNCGTPGCSSAIDCSYSDVQIAMAGFESVVTYFTLCGQNTIYCFFDFACNKSNTAVGGGVAGTQ